MADKTPIIEHSGFKSAIDSDYINIGPKGSIQYCEDSKNLTPFDKVGSMSQTGGHGFSRLYADMPHVSGFKPIDFYYFSVDRDQKEITVLIYQSLSTQEIKIFITPYFNPEATFSNNNPNKTANTWISEWLEITEYYSTTISSLSGTNDVISTGILVATDDYFNGWFLVNSTLPPDYVNSFNFVTNWDKTSKTLTCKSKIDTNYTTGDTIMLFRFPVFYFYNSTPNGSFRYSLFTPIPTEFRAKGNELRIAMGKDNKPLILEMIYKRQYFLGNNNTMSYDGFYTDLSQIPQRLIDSIVTGFKTKTTASTSLGANSISTTGTWVASGSGTSVVRLTRQVGSGTIGIALIPSGLTNIPGLTVLIDNKLGVQVIGSTTNIFIQNSTITQTAFISAFNTTQNPLFNLGYICSADVTTPIVTSVVTTTIYVASFTATGGTSFIGVEAGGKQNAYNHFLGTKVSTGDAVDGGNVTTLVDKNIFITSVLIDNRDEIIFGLGTFSPTATSATPLVIQFTPWFSRRITHFNIYNKKDSEVNIGTSGNIANSVAKSDTYPFFLWAKLGTSPLVFSIHEVPLFNTYSIFEFTKSQNGEIVYGIVADTNTSTGINCYSFDGHYWKTQLSAAANRLDTDGKNVRWIVNTNRYIDQDTTINYTRSIFNGQTNGRYFLINCKNTVEKELFDNDDFVLSSNYAYGVSQYNTFLRDRALPINQGDKDINQTIHNLGGRLSICKKTSNPILEVNTDSDIKYRIIEANDGRGTTFVEGVLQTPYGLFIPTKEAIWLNSGREYIPVLDKDNSKLKLYRDLINFYDADIIGCAYNNEKNQAHFFIQWLDDITSPVVAKTYEFIYNLVEKHWTYNYFEGNITTGGAGIYPIKIRTNANNEIHFLNYYNSTTFSINYLYNLSSTFLNADQTTKTILWNYETLFTAYNGISNEINLEKIWLNIDLHTTSTAKIKIRVYLDTLGEYFDIDHDIDNIASIKNKILTLLPAFSRSPTYIKFKIYNVDYIASFALNALMAKENSDVKKFTNNE